MRFKNFDTMFIVIGKRQHIAGRFDSLFGWHLSYSLFHNFFAPGFFLPTSAARTFKAFEYASTDIIQCSLPTHVGE